MQSGAVLAILLTAGFFIICGGVGLRWPELFGAELLWNKNGKLCCPRWQKATNPYYCKQIQMVAKGFWLGGLLLLIFCIFANMRK